MDELNPIQFQDVQMNNIAFIEDLLFFISLLHDIDIVGENIVGELAWRSVQKHEITVRLLRYNIYVCCVSTVIAVFQSFRCSYCGTSSNKNPNGDDI